MISRTTDVLSKNKFVETALAYVLTYVSEHISSKIDPVIITILADDDYYSQSQTSTKCTRNVESQFKDFNVTLSDAHKTGLGSSAALVTAFTAAVLAYYVPDSKADPDIWKSRIHNLAQAAHCTAQGKIGSGFDVAAAVYGSCVYRRFSPSVLESIGNMGTKDFSIRLKTVIDDSSEKKVWDTEIRESAVTMPTGLRLVMCDVDCGSETPSMVRKVFAWRKENVNDSLLLWETLQRGNEDLASQLGMLSADSGSSTDSLAATISAIRSLIREMSQKANVEIEPRVQTELLDACTKIRGVVGGVVPGAGGYDALALIVEDDKQTMEQLSTLLKTYTAKTMDAQESNIGKVRLLEARQEMQGLLPEQVELYKGWV